MRAAWSSPRVLVPAALVLAGLGFVAWRGGSAAAAPEVPDPRSPDMVGPVRRALEAAREAVLAEGSAESWGKLGMVCDAHHLYDEAVHCYRVARELAPEEYRWVYHLAVTTDFLGGEAGELVGLFEEAIRLQPTFPPARLRYGDALVRLGSFDAAREAFATAIALDSDFAMAHRNLGQVLLALDDAAGAVEHLELAAGFDPSDAVVFTSLARAYRLVGDEERAAEAAELSRTLEPVYGVPDPLRYEVDGLSRSPLACDRRARESEERGDHAAALEDLLLLAEILPGDAAVQNRLGVAYQRTGELDSARAHLRRALELSAELVDVRLRLAAIEEAQGLLEEAERDYRMALEARPGDAGVRKRLGALLGRRGDSAGALLEFERAASLAEADAELHHNWGTVLDRLERTQEACLHYRAALALAPDNAGSHFNLGIALARLGRVSEAIEHLERASELDPSLPAGEPLAALRATLDGGR